MDRKIVYFTVGLGVAAAISVPGPAASNWWGNTGNARDCIGVSNTAEANQNMTTDKGLDTAYINLESNTADAADLTRFNLINPTSWVSLGDATPDEETDLEIRDVAYTTYDICAIDYGFTWYDSVNGGTIGYTGCEDVVAGGRCDQHVVRISTIAMGDLSTSLQNRLLCHEIGHAMGLKHRANPAGQSWGCMNTPITTPGTFAYSGHDLDHMEAFSASAS